jgi:hypothetical protein
MEDLELDDDVITDDEVVIPDVEARVPADWQSKMSTRALQGATPMPLEELVETTAATLAARVSSGAAGSSLPTFVWERLSAAKENSHKATEQALSSIVSGVESLWKQHHTVQLFGELCGMLSADYSEVVARRTLGLLAPDATPPLLPADSIASTLAADGDDGRVGLEAALEALPRLRLSDQAASELESEVRGLDEGGAVRLDQLLLAAAFGVRNHAASGPADIVEEEEELSAQIQAAADKAAAEAAEAAAPAEAPAADGGEYEEDEFAADDADEGEEVDEEAAEEEAVVEAEEEAEAAPAPAPSAAPGALGGGASAWTGLAGAFAVGPAITAVSARQQLYDALDSGDDGLSLDELVERLPAALRQRATSGVAAAAEGALLAAAVSRAFEVAQSLGESMALAAQTKLSRDGFDRFVAYLHGTCVLHGMLNVSVRAEELPDDVDGDELLGSAPAEWGLSGVSFEQIAASDYTAESATHIVHSVVLAAVRSLVSGVIESTQPSGGAEAAAADEGEGGGESFPPPLGGLTPVLESTERSAFSSTAEWGGKGGSGSSELASARDDQLASVKKGFFDASQLDASIDESADLSPSAEAVPEAELRARYEPTAHIGHALPRPPTPSHRSHCSHCSHGSHRARPPRCIACRASH